MHEAETWPLAGLRVLELASEISGPYCGKLLVDAGATVIKVESPDGGDPLRRWTASGHPLDAGEDGVLFQFLNASKRGIAIDLESAAGRAEVLDFAATADLVIEDLGPGEMTRLGLALDALQARNPGVCLVSISPWGQTGPWAHRPCTEFTLQAATGSTAYRGLPDRKPVAAGGRVGEWVVGSFAAMGGLSAWLSARNTGVGQLVDVSAFEAVLVSMTIFHDLNGQWFEGPLPRAVEIPSIEPAKDGWVGLSTITGQQWKDFCALIGQPEVSEDDRYYDGRARMAHIEYMHEIIHAWTRERTVDEIVEVANLMRIPAAPVGNGRTLPTMDHFVERGVFVDRPGGFIQPRIPYRLEKTPLRPFGRAPALDEHRDELIEALGEASPRARAGEGGSQFPLAGLRVIDMTAFWAGPFATTYLADMGADVVKVESIQRPDGMRFAGSVRNDCMWEWSPVFAGTNLGKRDLTLQLDSEEGLALLKRLIADADVLMENFSARVLENFGLSWEVVRELNPRLIMVRMPSFGLDGPWRDRTGFAMTVEQVSGLAWMTGYEDLPLVLRGTCDPAGGAHAVCALLMALEHRRRTGEGQLVELPLVEVAINFASEQILEYSAYGQLLTRDENRGPVAAPQGLYGCRQAEEFVALAVRTDAQWQALLACMGNPEWGLAPELAHVSGRREQHDEIDRRLEAWFSEREREQAVAQLIAADVPAAAVINAHYVMPNPQLEAREFFQEMEHPVTGKTRYPGFPMNFSSLGTRLSRRPPPTLGQHNQEILGGELGLSEDELEELREAKIIGNRPTFM